VSGEAERLVKRALALDPNHMKALALAGTAAFQQQDFVKASAYWEQVLAQVPPAEEFARSIRASINEARIKGGMPALDHEALPQAGAGKEAAAGTPLP
jgi:cytochrome c-type biogenesis protein CcmH